MKNHKTTKSNTSTRVRNPRSLLVAPQQIPGTVPTICPAGLAKPGSRPTNPR